MQHATLCYVINDQRILMGYKKTGLGAGKFNGFGGKVEPGEAIAAAAVRELREECGLETHITDIQPVAHLTFHFSHRPAWDQIVHVYLVDRWEGEPQSSREMEPRWYSQDAIPYDQMWSDDVLWLPRVLAGERVQADFTFGADNETLNGHKVEILSLPKEATLCVVMDGERVLLGLKKEGFGAGKYVGFGGKIENGETIVAAAARELHEECGLVVDPAQLRPAGHLTFQFPHKPNWDHNVHVFRAAQWLGEPQESAEVCPAWFGREAVPYAQMWDDGRWWLPGVLDGEYVRGWFEFGADNEHVLVAVME